MPNKRSVVDLTEAERNELRALTDKGAVRTRNMKQAQELLNADAGLTDADFIVALDVSRPCVEQVQERFSKGGLARALNDSPRSGQRRKSDSRQEARLIAEVCIAAPAGHARRTLQLLARQMCE